MSKHTPGPWRWEETGDGWDGKTTHFVAPSVIESSDDGKYSWPKSVLHGWGYDASGIEVEEADAHLIAAAPELLEALIRLRKDFGGWVEGFTRPDEWKLQEWIRIADAAIAKAAPND